MIEAAELTNLFDVDFHAGTLTWKNVSKYHKEKNGCPAGTPRKNRNDKVYWVITIRKHAYKRSRIIFAMAHGRWPKDNIDHINGNSTDDRLVNIREATATQNAWNHKTRSKRLPLPMGVRVVGSGRYQARISCNKQMHHLGTYATPEEASIVYRQHRKEKFGAFA